MNELILAWRSLPVGRTLELLSSAIFSMDEDMLFSLWMKICSRLSAMNKKSHKRLFYLTYTQTKMLSKKKKKNRPRLSFSTIFYGNLFLIFFSQSLRPKRKINKSLSFINFHDFPNIQPPPPPPPQKTNACTYFTILWVSIRKSSQTTLF